tara:strand:+ start:801 stop:1097 length:297 start_codon:yes stop_codon:yes gene_type:complete
MTKKAYLGYSYGYWNPEVKIRVELITEPYAYQIDSYVEQCLFKEQGIELFEKYKNLSKEYEHNFPSYIEPPFKYWNGSAKKPSLTELGYPENIAPEEK